MAADVFCLALALLELVTGKEIYADQPEAGDFGPRFADQVYREGKRPTLPPTDEGRYPADWKTLIEVLSLTLSEWCCIGCVSLPYSV